MLESAELPSRGPFDPRDDRPVASCARACFLRPQPRAVTALAGACPSQATNSLRGPDPGSSELPSANKSSQDYPKAALRVLARQRSHRGIAPGRRSPRVRVAGASPDLAVLEVGNLTEGSPRESRLSEESLAFGRDPRVSPRSKGRRSRIALGVGRFAHLAHPLAQVGPPRVPTRGCSSDQALGKVLEVPLASAAAAEEQCATRGEPRGKSPEV